MRLLGVYPELGRLLSYPHRGETPEVAPNFAVSEELHTEASAALDSFLDQLSALEPNGREELFTRTFDILPSCDPYVSSQIFGQDSYQRGQLMSGLASAYKEAGFSCEPELPDFIGVILRFSDRFSNEEWEDLVRLCLWTAVGRMSASIKSSGNPYSALFAVIVNVFELEFPDLESSTTDTPLRVLDSGFMEECHNA